MELGEGEEEGEVLDEAGVHVLVSRGTARSRIIMLREKTSKEGGEGEPTKSYFLYYDLKTR